MNETAKGLLITCAGVLLVVPDAVFVRLIDADALTIAFWRLMLAGSVLGVGLFALKGAAPFRAVLATGWPGLIYMAGVGGSGLMFILAVSQTTVANVVFIIATLPVFAALYSRVFLGEPFSARMALTMVAVGVGLSIIAYGSSDVRQASLAGDAMALSVAMIFAAALTAARKAKPVSMVPGVALGYVGAAVLLLPVAAPFSVPVSDVPMVAAHGLFILASSVLLAIGPRFITSAEVGLLVLLESALAPLLAWALVNEHPGGWALIGGAVVIGSLFVSNVVALRRSFRSRR